jgi:hypothetical protein
MPLHTSLPLSLSLSLSLSVYIHIYGQVRERLAALPRVTFQPQPIPPEMDPRRPPVEVGSWVAASLAFGRAHASVASTASAASAHTSGAYRTTSVSKTESDSVRERSGRRVEAKRRAEVEAERSLQRLPLPHHPLPHPDHPHPHASETARSTSTHSRVPQQHQHQHAEPTVATAAAAGLAGGAQGTSGEAGGAQGTSNVHAHEVRGADGSEGDGSEGDGSDACACRQRETDGCQRVVVGVVKEEGTRQGVSPHQANQAQRANGRPTKAIQVGTPIQASRLADTARVRVLTLADSRVLLHAKFFENVDFIDEYLELYNLAA